MFGQRKWIPYVVGILILFLGGVATGYYAWGIDHQGSVDYKELLYKTASYISGLEDQIKASGKPVSDASNIDQTVISANDKSGFGQGSSRDQTGQLKLPATANETFGKTSPAVEQTGKEVNAAPQGMQSMPQQDSPPQEIISALLKTRDALEEENTVLRSVVADNQDLIAGKEQLQEENARLKEKLAQLESKNDEMQASALKAEELATENAKLQDEIDSLRDEIAALKIRLSKISVLVKDENAQIETSSQEPSANAETGAVTDTQEQ